MRLWGGLIVVFWCAQAFADSPTPRAADRIEAVQTKVWVRHAAFGIAPLVAVALDDPFVIQAGGGVRLSFWPTSLLGVGVEGSAFGQASTQASKVAQRELRARLKPVGGGWALAAIAEVVAVDGKVAGFGKILPFEMALRAGVGAVSRRNDFHASLTPSLQGALVARWFVGGRVGVETNVVVRTAALESSLDTVTTSVRDTTVAFEIAIPFLLGGGA